MKFRFSSVLASLALLASGLLATPARAALPTGTLSFVTPTATVDATESINVWLRYTLDAGSSPLSFNSNPLSGFAAADLPTQGSYYDPATNTSYSADFASYTRAYLNTFLSCSDTFTNGCNGAGAQYNFTFFTTSQPGMPSVNFVEQFNLQPGESYDYVFGTLTPKAGGAAPGTYSLFNSGLTLSFVGTDADGHILEATVDLASSCPSESAGCAFTRTVLAVPEPSSYALMVLGLGLVGWSAAHRRSAR